MLPSLQPVVNKMTQRELLHSAWVLRHWCVIMSEWIYIALNVSSQAFFCTKPKNSVPDFQKLSSQKSQKTQFLPKNSVPKVSKNGFLGRFSAKVNPEIQIFAQKPPNFPKTQFQKPKNSVFQKFQKHEKRKKCTKNPCTIPSISPQVALSVLSLISLFR